MLSDGVFAIAITLAALEIRLPEHAASFSELLRRMIEPLLVYAISFGIIALFWLRNRDLFARVQRVDLPLTMLNLALLCTVSLIPVGVRGNAEFDSEAGFRLYALTMFLAGSVNAALWGYAALRSGIMRPAVPRSYRVNRVGGAVLLATVFGLLPFIPLAISIRAILVLTLVFTVARRFVGLRLDRADSVQPIEG